MPHTSPTHHHVPSPLQHSSPVRSSAAEIRRGRVRRPTNARMTGMGIRRFGSGLQVEQLKDGDEPGERVVDGKHLLHILSDLESTIATHQLRLQTLQSTISHKLAEFPSITDRFRDMDEEAIGLLELLVGPVVDPSVDPTKSLPLPSGTNQPPVLGGSPPLVPANTPLVSPIDLTTQIPFHTPTVPSPIRPIRVPGSSSDDPLIPAQVHLEELQGEIEKAGVKVQEVEGSLEKRRERVEEARVVFGRVKGIKEELKRRIEARHLEIIEIENQQERMNLVIFWSLVISGLILSIALTWWYSDLLPLRSEYLTLLHNLYRRAVARLSEP